MYLPERRQIAELFNLADELEAAEKTEENYRILSDIFSYLELLSQKAYKYLSEVANPSNAKDAKKVISPKDRIEQEGDRSAIKTST